MSNDAFLIRPVAFTNEMLVSSNAVEAVPLWDEGKTSRGWETSYYATRGGAADEDSNYLVRSTIDGRIYESIVGTGWTSGYCSISAANPAVVTTGSAHGLKEFDPVTFPAGATTGVFPESVAIGMPYLVHVIDETTFNLYESTNPDFNDSLVDTSSDSPSDLWSYTAYDLNTGWWADPGDPNSGNTATPTFPWQTWPRWVDRGPNNTMAMFDSLIGTATTWEGDGEVTIAPATRCDSIGFEGLIGASLRIEVSDGGVGAYDQTFALIDNSEVVDWYTFFYGERRQRETIIIDDLPGWVLEPEIDLTISAAAGVSAIGAIQMGRKFDIGSVETGLGLGIDDFTVKDRTEFGEYNVVERDCAKTAEGRAWLPNSRRTALHKVLKGVRAIPVFWNFGDDEDQQILGFFRSYATEQQEGGLSLTSYEIEGVI